MPKGYLYILECSDGSFYTGSTTDLERRFYQHQNGEGAKYTKSRLPVKLVYHQAFDEIYIAFDREQQVKRWSRKKKLALIEGRFEDLVGLSTSSRTSSSAKGDSTEV